MTLFVGYIFSGLFGRFTPKNYEDDPVAYYQKPSSRFLTPELKMSIMVTAPALILHELAHKFVALTMGVNAIFHAFYANGTTLVLGVLALLAKLSNFGFFLIVPGFVSICEGMTSCPISALQASLIAFAGPLLNLLLWGAALLLIKYGNVDKRYLPLLYLTKKINLFLFFFNMIPIGPFDGAKVLFGILRSFG